MVSKILKLKVNEREILNSNRIIPYEMLYEAVVTAEELTALGVPENELLILKSFLRNIKPALKRTIVKAQKGFPVIAHHFAYPGEIFNAFDVADVVVETVPYTLSALVPAGPEKYYDIAGSFGHPHHSCSSQKGTIGMYIDDLYEFDALATPTAPCDNTFANFPLMQHLKDDNVPLITPDMPIYRDERAYKYFADELMTSIYQIGEAFGQEPDFKKLATAMEYTNRDLELIAEINELKKVKPNPIESMYCPLLTGIAAFAPGTPEKTQFFSDVLEVGKDRVKHGERAAGGEEKIRVMWPYMALFFDIGFCEWFDREMGMTMLHDIFTYPFYDKIETNKDPETLVEGIARQAMNYPMVRQSSTQMDFLIDDFVYLSKEYEADCAIFTVHLACKQVVSAVQILREALRDELGIPMLSIDVDAGDGRVTSIETIKSKITNFVETLLI
ncbi:MAG: 2-hydroxyacyl-CoA dehydratase [Promethearchaeota archaeon]|nr:MAG: 2-hydroxyacyl-CoA dehydratase [Candidatus Lokiarchaeota archaeon]